MKKPNPKFSIGARVHFRGEPHRVAGVFWEPILREWLYSLEEHRDFRLLEGMLTYPVEGA